MVACIAMYMDERKMVEPINVLAFTWIQYTVILNMLLCYTVSCTSACSYNTFRWESYMGVVTTAAYKNNTYISCALLIVKFGSLTTNFHLSELEGIFTIKCVPHAVFVIFETATSVLSIQVACKAVSVPPCSLKHNCAVVFTIFIIIFCYLWL